MKLSNLVYAAAGYVLGARAGRERYEDIVRVSRRVAGSQTVQATAGVVQARFDQLGSHAKRVVATTLTGAPHASAHNVNGYHSN